MEDKEKPEPKIKKNCGDCGRFVLKPEWLPEMNWKGQKQHPLCSECRSDYDWPAY